MAQDGCWGPTCDFTGSRTQSDAHPGRCTKTGGYVAAAEINEIIKGGNGVQTFHDAASNSDIMLYLGSFLSFAFSLRGNHSCDIDAAYDRRLCELYDSDDERHTTRQLEKLEFRR